MASGANYNSSDDESNKPADKKSRRRFVALPVAAALLGLPSAVIAFSLLNNNNDHHHSPFTSSTPVALSPKPDSQQPGASTAPTPLRLATASSGASTPSSAASVVLPQDISTAATPTFTNLNLVNALDLQNGGTGANTPDEARANLGAAASGVNSDITRLTGLSSIAPTGTLTLGSTTQAYVLQGNSSSVMTATGAGNTTTLAFSTPMANTILNLPALSAGDYTLCTTSGNCAGSGSGVTTAGGKVGQLAIFSGPQSLATSIASDDGTKLTIAGGALVQGAAGQAVLTLGKAGISKGSVVFTNDVNSNTVTLQSGAATSNLAFTLPSADGTAGDCLSTNGSGIFGFRSCTGGVSSLDGVIGGLTLANSSSSGNIITVNDASTTAKGLAKFNGTNFAVAAGSVNLVQDIATSSTPTFSGLSVNGVSGLAVSGSGGVGVTGSGALNVSSTGGLSVSGPGGVGVSGAGGISVSGSGGVSVSGPGGITSSGSAAITAAGSGGLSVTSGSLSVTSTSGASIDSSGGLSVSGAGGVSVSATNGLTVTSAAGETVGSSTNTGQIVIMAGGGSANSITLSPSTLTASRSILLPDEAGTVCLRSSTACGFAPTSGSSNYIQNGTTVQTGNFALQSASAGSVGAIIRGAAGQTADLLQVQDSSANSLFRVTSAGVVGSGDQTATSAASGALTVRSGAVAGATANSGAVTVATGNSTTSGNTGGLTLSTGNATSGNSGSIALDVGTATGTKGTISVGTTNASAISIARSGVVTTVNGTLSVTGSGTNSIMYALGLGTSSPQANSLTIANGWWLSGVDSQGGTLNMFSPTANNDIQVGAALNVDGGIMLPTDGGQLTLSDMGFSATGITAGTPESYTLRVGSSNALTVYGENDGSGNAQNVRVAVGGSITPAYPLDVTGDINTSANVRSGGTIRLDSSGNLSNIVAITSSGTFSTSGNILQSSTGTFTTGSGAVSLNGATTVKPGAASATAFSVQNTSSVAQLNVDTTNYRVTVGKSGGDTTGTILTLGNKTNTGDPTGVDGSIYYNSFWKQFRCDVGGTWKACGNTLATVNTSVPTSNTVANTTTETNFNSNYALAANECQAGKEYIVTAYGVYSTTGTPNLTLKAKLGTSAIGSTPVIVTPSAANNREFKVEFRVVCDTVGAGGTVEGQGEATLFSAAGAAGLYEMSNTATIAIDTTAAQTLQLSATWGTANAANTITLRQFTVETAGP